MDTANPILVVVDVQNDFIDGALPADKDRTVTKRIAACAANAAKWNMPIVFTRDTHHDSGDGKYEDTLEGKNLPVPHCIEGTHGWEIADELKDFVFYDEENGSSNVVDKSTFGSYSDLPDLIECQMDNYEELYGKSIDQIDICGFDSDICVVSNALILRARFPNMKINVFENLCAGSSPERHAAALEVLKSNQIDVNTAFVEA